MLVGSGAARAWRSFSDASELRAVILSSDRCLVLFTLEGCPPCETLKSELDLSKMATEDLLFLLFQVEYRNQSANPAIANWRISGFPQLRLYKNGKLISAVQGANVSASHTSLTQEVSCWIHSALAESNR